MILIKFLLIIATIDIRTHRTLISFLPDIQGLIDLKIEMYSHWQGKTVTEFTYARVSIIFGWEFIQGFAVEVREIDVKEGID